MVFVELFNEITDNRYAYIMPSRVDVNVTKATVCLELIVPHEKLDNTLTEYDKEKIFEACRSIIPMSFELTVKYKKFYVDGKLVINRCNDYFSKNYPAIPSEGVDIEATADGDTVNIAISIASLFYSSVDKDKLIEELTLFLHSKFSNPVQIDVMKSDKEMNLDTACEKKTEEFYVRRRVKTEGHFKMTGRSIGIDPAYISDHSETEENAVYCGKIEAYERRISKKGFPYYTFTINDTTGRLICKAFSKTEISEYDHIAVDDTVIVQGRINIDAFARDSVLLVGSLSKCVIDYASIVNDKQYKKAPKYYEYVKPYKFVSAKQVNFFSAGQEIPVAMSGKTFIVFDLETTGLNKDVNKIIEIGAVKIEDGVIKECFSSFVDPEEPISDEITKLTSITDDDVKEAPTIDKVLPDFYKFSEGIPLVAHNAPFDTGFIYYDAKSLNYNFDNKVYDTCDLAKKVVMSPNYKLGTLCKTLNISLENAHRAIHDATATAELFIELARIAERRKIRII